MNANPRLILKLIIQRFIRQFGATFFAWVIAPMLLLAALILIMSFVVYVQCRTVGELNEPGYRPPPAAWRVYVVPEKLCN